MQLEISLTTFYSIGDERRFFQGLKDIEAIKEIRGVGRGLIIKIEMKALNKEMLRELIALLWRYGISLAPLKVFASNNKKFTWLDDERCYWYKSMFETEAR
ncbi:hypothetical protein OYT1_ch2437 [Ferriphaselus amnicola]|jgi:hypothetical protein|uniref:Uncharacterized protein n=1 Tax=Ferriphaselus amnicola TaxID=1188319 RepID=A0A2Z6GES8_9PROT|nr:hypothetical protein [Ferriphaselus amnicola]BBE51950.1 hypothetical protein OYT1_ch2437 [Ferriphaselus amnicola]